MADTKTYWNGEPCRARQVIVTVADIPSAELYWARDLVGTERKAVEIIYGGDTFYIDDEGHERTEEDRRRIKRRFPEIDFDPLVGYEGWGWAKVTSGRGSPRYGHFSLNVSAVRDRD